MTRDPSTEPLPPHETRHERAARRAHDSEQRLLKAIRGESLPAAATKTPKRLGPRSPAQWSAKHCLFCNAKFAPKSGRQKWCGLCPKP